MLTPDHKRKAASGGMFIVPIILVLGTARVLAPPMVAVTTAGEVPVDLADLVTRPSAPKMSAAAEAAAQHLLTIAEEPFPVTPFHHDPAQRRTGENPTTMTGAPEFTVRAILASSRGNIALTSAGKLQVGDAFADTGWTVKSIDAVQRTVTLENPKDGRTVTRGVRRGD